MQPQTKYESLLESIALVVVGFIVNLTVLMTIVSPLFGFHSHLADSIGVTAIFTVSSLIKNYVLRRVFTVRRHKKLLQEKL